MTYPAALHFVTRPASTPGAGTVVFVHGSLDRGDSFRLAMRRLPEFSGLVPNGLYCCAAFWRSVTGCSLVLGEGLAG